MCCDTEESLQTSGSSVTVLKSRCHETNVANFIFMYLKGQVQEWLIFNGDFTETTQYASAVTYELQKNTYWRIQRMKDRTH